MLLICEKKNQDLKILGRYYSMFKPTPDSRSLQAQCSFCYMHTVGGSVLWYTRRFGGYAWLNSEKYVHTARDQKVIAWLPFTLAGPVERGGGFGSVCLTLKIYHLGPEVHVFKGRKSLSFLWVSLNVGGKALTDEDGSGTSVFFLSMYEVIQSRGHLTRNWLVGTGSASLRAWSTVTCM